MFSFLVAIALYFAKLPAASVVAAPVPSAVVAPVLAPASAVPVKADAKRLGLVTASRAVLVADWATGAPLLEKNADNPQPIASITKLVTALTIIGEKPDWDMVVEVTGADTRAGGVTYFAPGDRLPLRDVMAVMLVASANEAAVAASRATGLSDEQFAARMNDTARRLGMTNAHFVEPTGLDSRDVASARDVAFLIRAAMDDSLIRETVLKPTHAFTTEAGRGKTARSTDELLGSFLQKPPYTFLGGKTGSLDEAGYCFAAAAERDGHRVIAVALGAPSKDQRFKDVKAMIFWAFDAYRWPETARQP
jgi:D-alanyl-D-alanine endopeptidase (penicillin-binding protein 7)